MSMAVHVMSLSSRIIKGTQLGRKSGVCVCVSFFSDSDHLELCDCG